METVIILLVILAVTIGLPEEVWDNSVVVPQGVENRIVGGQYAKPNQFPYQARLRALIIKNGRMYSSTCGGALISDKTILTAAHCLDGATSVVIYLGSTKINGDELTHVQTSVWKKNIIIHRGWNSTTLVNDIALIKLSGSVQLNAAVKTVNLPRASQVALDNQVAVIAGFGKTAYNSKAPSNDLLFIQRKILPNIHCNKVFLNYYKDSLHLCVDGSQRKSTCSGDSGGPLVIEERNGIKTIVGIMSFGAAKCDANFPIVFTKVSAHLNWIAKNTGLSIRN